MSTVGPCDATRTADDSTRLTARTGGAMRWTCGRSQTQHLTYGECLEIVVKRYQRWTRTVVEEPPEQLPLFGRDLTPSARSA